MISVILALLLSPTVFNSVVTLAWGLAILVNYRRYIKANEAKLLVQNLVTYEPISSILRLSSHRDYVSSCGITLMSVVYQLVGFGWGDSRHSGGSVM